MSDSIELVVSPPPVIELTHAVAQGPAGADGLDGAELSLPIEQSDVTGLIAALNAKADSSLLFQYVTSLAFNTALAGKANVSHNHTSTDIGVATGTSLNLTNLSAAQIRDTGNTVRMSFDSASAGATRIFGDGGFIYLGAFANNAAVNLGTATNHDFNLVREGVTKVTVNANGVNVVGSVNSTVGMKANGTVSGGALEITGGAGIACLYFYPNGVSVTGQMYNPSNGKFRFTNGAVTSGAILDFTTDNTVIIRNRADNALGTLEASAVNIYSGATQTALIGPNVIRAANGQTLTLGSTFANNSDNISVIRMRQTGLITFGNQVGVGSSATDQFEVNNGTLGTLRDLAARNLVATGGPVQYRFAASSSASVYLDSTSGYPGVWLVGDGVARTTANYSLLSVGGQTLVNSNSGSSLNLRIGNVDAIIVGSDRNVSIPGIVRTDSVRSSGSTRINIRAESAGGSVAIQSTNSIDAIIVGGHNAVLVTIAAQVAFSAVITTPLSSNTNDFTRPVAYHWRVNCTTACDLTGMSNGVEGSTLNLINVGTQTLTLKHESANSIAANRFLMIGAADLAIAPNEWAAFYYDSTIARWRVRKV